MLSINLVPITLANIHVLNIYRWNVCAFVQIIKKINFMAQFHFHKWLYNTNRMNEQFQRTINSIAPLR